MIDRRELLAEARRRGLPLTMIEKDYVLGWMLFGVSRVFPHLVLKGGTALSKVYLPRIWRLSEDLDFTLVENEAFAAMIKKTKEELIPLTETQSQLKLILKSEHFNPGYLQLKIQYVAVLGVKNWLKIDITRGKPAMTPRSIEFPRAYSDYPDLRVVVKPPEEILADKLYAILRRTKCRDYYDVWRLLATRDLDVRKALSVFREKCAKDELAAKRADLLPIGLAETLKPYWERELARLVSPYARFGERFERVGSGSA